MKRVFCPYWFSKNVVVETSYQMLEILSICGQESAYLPSIKVTVLISFMKKVQWSFLGCCFFVENICEKKLYVKSPTCSHSHP